MIEHPNYSMINTGLGSLGRWAGRLRGSAGGGVGRMGAWLLTRRRCGPIRSEGSILSIGSKGSVLSIGSVGSILSIGSVGSALSAFSIGSAASVGSLLSALSRGSVLSYRSRRALLKAS